MTREEMLEEISDKLIIYLKSGNISTKSFLQKIDPNIKNLKQLIRIHFLLHDDVREFITSLPVEIRNIKTSTKKINRLYKGEVRGRISWQKTIANRYQTGCPDSTAYVCQETSKDFNINENLVLKKLLSIINSIVFEDLVGQPENYTWLEDWLGEANLTRILRQVYYRNIYIRRIDISGVNITPRMIESARLSRNSFYRKAANLLKKYYNYIEQDNWKEDSQALKELFKNTFIQPESESVLFELYWIIKLIAANQADSEGYQLQVIDGHSNKVATWKKAGKIYNLYHDSAGSDRLKFSLGLKDLSYIKNEYLRRKVKAKKAAIKISDLFDVGINNNIWSGRPDLIVEVINNDDEKKLSKLIIGEIKYSANENTIKTGLKELMDYCYLVQEKAENDYFNGDIEGLLLFDSIDIKTNSGLESFKAFSFKKDFSDWQTEKYISNNIEF